MTIKTAVLALLVVALSFSATAPASNWSVYGGDQGGQHYAPLALINRGNVGQLELAWQYRHGELENFRGPRMLASWHVTPILLPQEAGQSLGICTPFNRVIALDPTTGKESWVFDPEVGESPEWRRPNFRRAAAWPDFAAEPQEGFKHPLFHRSDN